MVLVEFLGTRVCGMLALGWATRRDAVPEPTGRHRSTDGARDAGKMRKVMGVAGLDVHSRRTLAGPGH